MSTTVLSLPGVLPVITRSLRRTTTVVSNPALPRQISSKALLNGARELVIQHEGGEYHLRLTRNDKLILTK